MIDKKNLMNKLRAYVEKNRKTIYTLKNKDKIIKVYLDTAYDSDNGLALDDENYEEYFCILFQKISDGSFVEINYHNLPDEIYDGETRII